MPSTRAANRKAQKPRRTHTLGGCATCRRRHVKCDQTRPQCNTCRNANLQCGGFPSPIRWASLSVGPPTSRTSLVKENTISNTQSDKSGSSEVQSRRLDQRHTLRTSAVDLDVQEPIRDQPNTNASEASPSGVGPNLAQYGFTDGIDDAYTVTSAPLQSTIDWGWLFDGSSGLGWNDLFDETEPFSMPGMPNSFGDDFSLQAREFNHSWGRSMLDESDQLHPTIQQFGGPQITETVPELAPPISSSLNSSFKQLDESSVLEDAKFLLRYFRQVVVPKFSPVPMASKSPWEIMNWRAAIHTHANISYLQSCNVTHASKANLFAVLGCAAYMLSKKSQMQPQEISGQSTQILDFTYNRSKVELQESLRLETSGSDKAKYKDQLMGITSLIALTTLIGTTSDARRYLIDAERLVRLRGLAKREVSRRARMLHHVYTWLRIVGESTFVLHDHESNALQSRIETMLTNNEELVCLSSSSDCSKTATREYSELDDFLRIEAHAADSETDMETSKDQESGIRDIHLADVRQWSQTLYMEVYGIPEVWLSLVSQVTRVANVMDYLEVRSVQVPQLFKKSLERKLDRLEQKICSFAMNYSTITALGSLQEHIMDDDPASAKPSVAHEAMLRAMSSALVIFFYRRLRKVNPWILQAHVNDVITALKDFRQAHDVTKSSMGSIGTPWPAFIAGCEAMSADSRQWLATWIENSADQSASTAVSRSQAIMRKVWEERDASLKHGKGSIAGKDRQLCSWVDVLRKERLWPMLY